MEDRAFQAENSMDKGPDREQGEETEARVPGTRIPFHLVLIKHLPPCPGLLLTKTEHGTVGLCNMLSQEAYVRMQNPQQSQHLATGKLDTMTME